MSEETRRPEVYVEMQCCCGARFFLEVKIDAFTSYFARVTEAFITAHKICCTGSPRVDTKGHAQQ